MIQPKLGRLRTADRRGDDPTLPGRDDGDARAFLLAEHHDLQALAQEGDVVVERVLGVDDGGQARRARPGRERRERGARQGIR